MTAVASLTRIQTPKNSYGPMVQAMDIIGQEVQITGTVSPRQTSKAQNGRLLQPEISSDVALNGIKGSLAGVKYSGLITE